MLLECRVIIAESVTVVKKRLVSAGLNVLVLLIRLSELVTSNTKVSDFLGPFFGLGPFWAWVRTPNFEPMGWVKLELPLALI